MLCTLRSMGRKKTRAGELEGGRETMVSCGECERWCWLEETPFETGTEAEGQAFTCKSCRRTDAIVAQLMGKIRELEAQVKDEVEVRKTERATWEAKQRESESRVEVEKTNRNEEMAKWKSEVMGELDRKREQWRRKIAELEQELELDRESGRKREESEREACTQEEQSGESSQQGKTAEKGAISKTYSEMVATGPKSQEHVEPQRGRGVGKRVFVVGDSNVNRIRATVMDRTKGDERVQVEAMPGKGVVEVMKRVGDMVWDNMEGNNLVMVAAGLNDILNRNSIKLEAQLAKGVQEIRNRSEKTEVVLCTIPMVGKQEIRIERRILEANRAIHNLRQQLGVEVVDVNREVWVPGPPPFDHSGIHYSETTARRVGNRLGGRAVAFLGGPRALVRKG